MLSRAYPHVMTILRVNMNWDRKSSLYLPLCRDHIVHHIEYVPIGVSTIYHLYAIVYMHWHNLDDNPRHQIKLSAPH